MYIVKKTDCFQIRYASVMPCMNWNIPVIQSLLSLNPAVISLSAILYAYFAHLPAWVLHNIENAPY